MALQAVEAPKSVLITNTWTMEVDGVPRATFTQVNGPARQIGNVERADGGTGILYHFSNQQVQYGTINWQRMYDPNDANDLNIETFMDNVITNGTKLTGEITKYFFGTALFRFQFTGLLFTSESHPTMNKNQSNAYTVTYTGTVDYWEKVGATS